MIVPGGKILNLNKTDKWWWSKREEPELFPNGGQYSGGLGSEAVQDNAKSRERRMQTALDLQYAEQTADPVVGSQPSPPVNCHPDKEMAE